MRALHGAALAGLLLLPPSASVALQDATLEQGLCASVYRTGLSRPRGMIVDAAGDVLVVESSAERVSALVDADSDGVAEQRFTVAQAPGLNHGITLSGGYLYASSHTHVYRWAYQAGQRSETTVRETVVHNIPADGRGGAPRGHTTRTLTVDSSGVLYVSVGSYQNVDADSFRSRIRRFPIPSPLPTGGIDFTTGEVFADGLRNEVGIAFDRHGVLWGVENGADNLQRADLGGDIHNDNPAEELNRFPESARGQTWGYPYCWTEFKLAGGGGRGTVWSWPSFMNDGTHTDQWCRANTNPPVMSLQAHSAPLGLRFFYSADYASRPSACSGGLGSSFNDNLFIGYHGSWNRDIPTGYKVVRVPLGADGLPLSPNADPIDVLQSAGTAARWPSGFRPVDVVFDRCGRLLVTSDTTHDVAVVHECPGAPSQAPSASPSAAPAAPPTRNPSTQAPTGAPAAVPTRSPAAVPATAAPSAPGATLQPSGTPSQAPTAAPTRAPASAAPSASPMPPTAAPTQSGPPASPTVAPTVAAAPLTAQQAADPAIAPILARSIAQVSAAAASAALSVGTQLSLPSAAGLPGVTATISAPPSVAASGVAGKPSGTLAVVVQVTASHSAIQADPAGYKTAFTLAMAAQLSVNPAQIADVRLTLGTTGVVVWRRGTPLQDQATADFVVCPTADCGAAADSDDDFPSWALALCIALPAAAVVAIAVAIFVCCRRQSGGPTEDPQQPGEMPQQVKAAGKQPRALPAGPDGAAEHRGQQRGEQHSPVIPSP